MPNQDRFPTIWVQTGDPTTVNETTPFDPGQLGAKMTVKNTSGGADPGSGAKTFQYVRVDSAAPVAPYRGAVAWWGTQDDFVVTTSATNRGRIAGVFAAATPNLGNYGFIQVKGPAIVKFIDAVTSAPTAAGLHVIPSATNAKADCLASGSAATFPLLGLSIGAYDAVNAEAEVNLRVEEVV